MKIHVLYTPDCPNYQLAIANVRAALAQLNRSDDVAVIEEVQTGKTSVHSTPRVASPTILLNGIDLFDKDTSVESLACRLYQSDSGLKGEPSVAEIVSALLAKGIDEL
ncbi:hypothetical protein [Glutamicibacter endophyticus]|uniref:hypothetical protein n=1 Tax=Glutamicibacter endophyticus TaxID=1522174 RepID=UPI003AF0902C